MFCFAKNSKNNTCLSIIYNKKYEILNYVEIYKDEYDFNNLPGLDENGNFIIGELSDLLQIGKIIIGYDRVSFVEIKDNKLYCIAELELFISQENEGIIYCFSGNVADESIFHYKNYKVNNDLNIKMNQIIDHLKYNNYYIDLNGVDYFDYYDFKHPILDRFQFDEELNYRVSDNIIFEYKNNMISINYKIKDKKDKLIIKRDEVKFIYFILTSYNFNCEFDYNDILILGQDLIIRNLYYEEIGSFLLPRIKSANN